MKNILLALSFIILFIGCKEEEQATIVGTWVIIDIYSNYEGVREPSQFSSWPNCSQDDELMFTTDGKVFFTEGAIKCSPETYQERGYEWDKGNKQIVYDKALLVDILELTPSTLTISPIPYPNARLRQVMVYRRK